ncbi:MAG: 16S rRNA (uracil(1498)-N(3))-methyltransferase [Gammaproteobacteria bacterium]|nr:16S rRNA (uracil(1498)-N(3))-methyltransferase [Gammaproteobacteria bacterium]
MREIRLFHDGPLASGECVTLEKSAAQHLGKVLRATVGQPVTLFNGQGGEWYGKVSLLEGRKAEVSLEEHAEVEREASVDMTLVQGLSRGERMDYTIQKAVEVGFSCIQPIVTERCVVKLDERKREKRHDHWLGIMRSACEQTGRNRVPELLPVITMDEYLAAPRRGIRHFMLDPDATGTPARLARPDTGVGLVIGPEGGFSETENAHLLAAGFEALRLGSRVLRTETAAVVAAAALLSRWGEYD